MTPWLGGHDCNTRLSRVFTITNVSTLERSSYVVCLTCGAEWAYDWSLMRRGERREQQLYRKDEVSRAREREDAKGNANTVLRGWSRLADWLRADRP